MRHFIATSDSVQYKEGDPLACYQQWMMEPATGDRILLVDFLLGTYWLEDHPGTNLTAIYLRSGDKVCAAVTDGDLHLDESDTMLCVAAQCSTWSRAHHFVMYECGAPIALGHRAIAKPWGQEIWYTGVEERGVCCFRGGSGNETPIPWLQAAVPGGLLGVPGEALVLLKILDPVAQPVIGDLYFELHEEKREVYVVTHVDRSAWPDGTGYIRMGFDRDKLQLFANDEVAFRTAYLRAVHDYEAVRRAIDELPPGIEVDPETLRQESSLRAHMDSFSHLRPLQRGDVVKVPLLTPHSLQHGVRTIEFQTPVYERKILSFAQKVLTQNHWDTAEAVAQMQLEPVAEEVSETLAQSDGILVERIVDFSDFEVRRVRLDRGSVIAFDSLRCYGLIMVVEGQLVLGGGEFDAEQALLLPVGWSGELICAQAASSVLFLLALPRN